MNPTPLGDTHRALAVSPRGVTRRVEASLAALILVAMPLVAVPASAAETADAPVFTGIAKIYGLGAVDTVFTFDERAGAWSPEPESRAYTWHLSDDALLDASDTPIEGATDATLTLLPEHLGKYVIGTVVATAAGAASDPVTATSFEPVAPGYLDAGDVQILGTVQVDSLLTADPGTWPEGTTLAYRWVINDRAVATTPTYTPRAAQSTKLLRLFVDGSKAGYLTRTGQSSIEQIVKATFTTTTPRIEGTVVVGGRVSATTDHFSPEPTLLTYQWRANGDLIPGATSRSYRIQPGLHGDKLTVAVMGERPGYRPLRVTSAASVVARPFGRAPHPIISGTPRVGQTLTAHRGTWSPTPSVIAYQWLAEGRPITGATNRTYKLTRAEHGKNISVEIVGSRYAYLPTTRRSASTTTVGWAVTPADLARAQLTG
jgi:hypothetical protein